MQMRKYEPKKIFQNFVFWVLTNNLTSSIIILPKGKEQKKQEGKTMKIKLTAEMKRLITVAEMPIVNKLIAAMKEDDSDPKEYAKMAARIAAGKNDATVLEASAEVATNWRVWDRCFDGSEHFDVWITFTAYADDCFVMGGAYLTDIWQITGENNDEIRSHMFIRKFAEIK